MGHSSSIFEIAYAAANQRLCLFTGTGFSKAVSDGKAPGWQDLLEEVCDCLPQGDDLKDALFPRKGDKLLSLEEAAQIIALNLIAIDKDINCEIADIIEALSVAGDIEEVKSFFREYSFRVVTTNYDKLSEELAGRSRVQSITPGMPIPRSSAPVKVYHIHGSIESPENLVVTSDDYFRFMNSDSYFSKKLSTILHENTVVIVGYSLGDTNLKRIINDYKAFASSHIIGSNIFFVSWKKVGQVVKDFYFHSYGIRVIDDVQVAEFFAQLNKAAPKVAKIVDRSLRSISNVIEKGSNFNDDYIKMEDSFFRIIASLPAKGFSLKDPRVVNVIGSILKRKRHFTTEMGAWDQYEHLASWLIHLGSLIDVSGSSIRKIYLSTVQLSMETMSKEKRFGFSWQAYQLWHSGWPSISSANRALIRKFITDQAVGPDAQLIVESVH